MYKIYIKDKPLYLEDFSNYQPGDNKCLTAVYMGKPVTLLQYIDTLEKANDFSAVHIYAKDLEALHKDFFGLYEVVDAAGGLVLNELGELMVIFRRGSWDIAKGKVDEGETVAEAAVREVEEETGARGIERQALHGLTYHTYTGAAGKRHLKRTYWYNMTAPKQTLIPQLEEGILQATWVYPESFLTGYRPMYPNIREIVSQMVSKAQ